jgi:hypothetical protein
VGRNGLGVSPTSIYNQRRGASRSAPTNGCDDGCCVLPVLSTPDQHSWTSCDDDPTVRGLISHARRWHVSDQHGGRSHSDRVWRPSAGGHIAYTRCWHVSNQHGRTPRGHDGAANVRHSDLYDWTGVHVADTSCWLGHKRFVLLVRSLAVSLPSIIGDMCPQVNTRRRTPQG